MDERISVFDLNFALNEARWLGIVPRRDLSGCLLVFDVLTLRGAGDGHAIVKVLLNPVTRVAASYRLGCWDDASAEVVPVTLDELVEVLASFDGQPISGMEFFARPSTIPPSGKP